jgi:hypothetical protein
LNDIALRYPQFFFRISEKFEVCLSSGGEVPE